MEIITLNHSDRYSVEQISCMFFKKGDEVKVVSEYNGKDKITTVTFLGDFKGEGIWEGSFGDERAFKNAVKKSAFISMSKVSGKETPWGILTGIRPSKFCRDLHENYSFEEIKNILINDYWVSEDKAGFCIEVTENSEKIIGKLKPEEVEIYIGIPFCPSRCSYCSFISESAALYSKYIPEYADALIKEIKALGELTKGINLEIGSVYIGGGTPPALGTDLLSEVIKTAKESFDITVGKEFTVEAGRPDVIDEKLLSMLKEYEVNRLCINPQTMNDSTLKLIGRNHNTLQTQKAFELARKYGFNNINSDLIAGLPGENAKMFEKTLDKIKLLSPEEITVHTMYLKRTSKITKEKLWDDCSNDVETMVNSAIEFAKENEYLPYYMYKQRSTIGNLENTGYAKRGFESYYNVAIMEEVRTILAAGAGASSKIVKNNNIERIYNIKDAFSYIRDIEKIISDKNNKLKEIL